MQQNLSTLTSTCESREDVKFASVDYIRKMKFEEIPVRVKNGVSGSVGVSLSGHWIFKWQMEFAWKQLQQSLPMVDFSLQRTAKYILNDDDWESRRVGVRIGLGRCVRFFVENRMIPLELSNPSKKGPRKYVRTDN